ncbi:hypothetical protein TNCV_2816981 [Trichonephila clavipes]|nr:hypothetical protein TNCV_2816981 [Trichonephila clavipes]
MVHVKEGLIGLSYLCPKCGKSMELKERTVCKEQLPAPGNRSNERRYREKDLATTEEKKLGTREERVAKKTRGREK